MTRDEILQAVRDGKSLTWADLRGADLTWADLRWANLIRADLTGADLTGADMTGADLYEANLTGANLTEANLTGAYLIRADLYEADLYKANLRGADLYKTNLTEAALSWSSHALLAEILRRAAGDSEPRLMLAGYVALRTRWCWKQWATWEHPEKEWALRELAKWVTEGDDSPDLVRQYVEVKP